MGTTLRQARTSTLFGRRFAAALLCVALAGLVASPVAALPIGGVAPSGGGIIYVAPPDPCQPQPQISNFAPQNLSIPFGTSTNLQWSVQVPSGCRYSVSVDGQSVGLQGSLPVQPLFDTTYVLTLQWGPTLGFSVRVTTTVQVTVPVDPSKPGRNLVTISSQQMVPMFVRALGTPNTTVNVTADLDLTGLYSDHEYRILIADGVQLIGGRIAVPGQPFQPGPRLFVTDCPQILFAIVGNNVKVSGARIEGASMSQDLTTCLGIQIFEVNPNNTAPPPSGVRVEIDHNEFSGWSDTALGVGDTKQQIVVPVAVDHRVTPADLVYFANPTTEPVWIHDNFFHHNQHYGTNGYGVAVVSGAHALIERNVFDWNRHAITSGRTDGRVGYRAYRNLVLEHGGLDKTWPDIYVQQFDMHGSDYCPFDLFHIVDYYCGLAGHDFDIRYNSFLYKQDAAVRLRGTPTLGLPQGAIMRFNVFAHDHESDAVRYTEGAPTVQDNVTGQTSYPPASTPCDFDGDGIADKFIATEQTLWYCPGPNDCVTAPGSGKPTWVYLNMSTKRVDQLSLGHFSGGKVCDVVDGSFISVGGSGPWKLMIMPSLGIQ